jgi:uncharacterized small protein (DUF1192 family)
VRPDRIDRLGRLTGVRRSSCLSSATASSGLNCSVVTLYGGARCRLKEDELLFVYGHPGRTSRLQTIDPLRFIRAVEMPARLASLWRREVQRLHFADRNPDNARMARSSLFRRYATLP